ncbi:hypothetical protein LCGC14_1694460 [marine sediment metagenome]|uniref:Uncharacterized protein n=1 Tax=marine sediment metagenome TaxID=412755 RepID=A0A0F9KJY8_9ZZZZ
MSKRNDEHSLRRFLYAQELNRRAGGDINKILPAAEDMMKEAAEKRKKEEQESGMNEDIL